MAREVFDGIKKKGVFWKTMGNCFGGGGKKEPFDFVLKDKFNFLRDESITAGEKEKKVLFENLPEVVRNENPETFYEKMELVGKGSYGEVYKVKRIDGGKEFACKIISCTKQTKDIIKHILGEVKKEIQVLSDMEGHENIVGYHDSFYYKTNFWIIIDLCGVGSVVDYIEFCNSSLSEQEICVIVKAMLKALAYLHSKRKIHRDVKSGNILITSKGKIKLGDFGLSAQLKDNSDSRRSVQGSPFWLAPEILMSRYGTKADVWSLGITIIEMAEKIPPYFSCSVKTVFENIQRNPSPKFKNPSDWSKNFNDFLSQCLCKNPHNRPSARKLMRHPFIFSVKNDKEVMKKVVEKMKKVVANTKGGKEELVRKLLKKEHVKIKKKEKKDNVV